MSRIQKTFADLQSQKKKALITFITAGDPAPELTVPLMHAQVKAGADILELGVPFSDPMAEGPVIQRANERALKFNVGMRDVLGYVREFRKDNPHTGSTDGLCESYRAYGRRQFCYGSEGGRC
jgi:tryptophan synthase alpha chain